MPAQISPATYAFFKGLKENNERPWFDAHRADYDAARADTIQLLADIKEKLEPLEPALRDQQSKDLLFRIYRDVRFSKNKLPFKTHFGAYFSRGGRKWEGGGYYLHIEPGDTFIGAGIWMPEGRLIKALRQEIDYNLAELESILNKPSFKKRFPKIEGDALSRPPQGFAPDNPALPYLKQKSFLVMHKLDDAVLQGPKAVASIVDLFKEAAPLVNFLNRALEDPEA